MQKVVALGSLAAHLLAVDDVEPAWLTVFCSLAVVLEFLISANFSFGFNVGGAHTVAAGHEAPPVGASQGLRVETERCVAAFILVDEFDIDEWGGLPVGLYGVDVDSIPEGADHQEVEYKHHKHLDAQFDARKFDELLGFGFVLFGVGWIVRHSWTEDLQL